VDAATPLIQISWWSRPDCASELGVQENVTGDDDTQALASGAVSVKVAGGVLSTRTLQVDVDWVVFPPLSRTTTSQVCLPSAMDSLVASV